VRLKKPHKNDANPQHEYKLTWMELGSVFSLTDWSPEPPLRRKKGISINKTLLLPLIPVLILRHKFGVASCKVCPLLQDQIMSLSNCGQCCGSGMISPRIQPIFIPDPESFYIRKGMRVFKTAFSAFLTILTGQHLLFIQNYVVNL
jgi:hypothetical protein